MLSPMTQAARIRAQMTSWLAGLALAMVMVQHSATRLDDEMEVS
jgi:hypothetical protein